MGVPVVDPTILYLMLNSSPVVGLGVMNPNTTSASRATPVEVFVEFASVAVI
jgi:hypothetical protein